MPYIVTVNQPGCPPEADPTAVATIEEARDAAVDHITGTPNTADGEWTLLQACQALAETGGVVGPMPDGYVIDVRPVTWEELHALSSCSIPSHASNHEHVLDAYNGMP